MTSQGLILSLAVCFACSMSFYACKGPSSSKISKKTETTTRLTPFDGKASIIFQDKQNNYWFGGNEKGVYQYDGNHWTLFSKKEGLCSHSILGIQEDSFGNIYFDTPDGISKFDGKKFVTLEVMTTDSSKNNWKLEPHDLWFRMGWDKKGPYRYDGQFLYYLKFPKPSLVDEFYAQYPNASFSPYGVYSMYKDSKGYIWFGTSSLGACRFDGKSIQWLYEKHLSEISGGGSFGIRTIIEDKQGHFWFTNTRYRYKILLDSTSNYISYQKEKGLEQAVKNNGKNFFYFMSSIEDNNGNLWMSTYDNGVWCKKGKKLIHYPIQKGILLFGLYKDRQGTIWLSAQNTGIYKYNGKNFELFISS